MLGRILLTGLLAATLMFAQGKKGGGSRGPDMPSVPFSGGNRLDRISDMLKLTKDQKEKTITAPGLSDVLTAEQKKAFAALKGQLVPASIFPAPTRRPGRPARPRCR